MKINNFIATAVAATLALTSCEKTDYDVQFDRDAHVKIMSENYVKTTAISSCTGLDTSFTVDFGVAMCINVATIPGIDDVRYDEYEFYAMLDGRKVKGFQNLKDQISDRTQGLIDGNINVQLSGHTDLAVYLLHENMYKAQFFVENGDGQLFELQLKEVY
tara:strand:- start:468 stop:947 length:480 start_codon:yes stop_codon:yes gene_type:complete